MLTAEADTVTPAGYDKEDFLRFKVYKGFEERQLPLTEEFKERIEYELKIIKQMNFASYFLVVADLCNWMEDNDILFIVRGSGCGSAVVWGLGISHPWLDPIDLELPFERFLNPDRISMPDLDIDIDDTRRDRVFDYTVQKYGSDRVAKIITFGISGGRAAIKDVCRAQALENYQDVANKINAGIPKVKKEKLKDLLAKSEYLREQQAMYPQVFEAAMRIEGRDRNAGVHAAGTVIGPDKLTKYVALYYSGNPETREPADNVPTTQWDMYDVEKRGLLKMDYLGLKTLRVLRQTRDSINAYAEHVGSPGRIAPNYRNIPMDCTRTWDMLAQGRTTCVFQIEKQFCQGYARRMSLQNQTHFRKLAVFVSIIRPGMMDTGATESYLRRANGDEQPKPIHPKLEELLRKNYGLLVYQEDCMWVARLLAGYPMSKADTLRRAIGKKVKKDIDAIKPDFVKCCIEHSQITKEEAEYVWSQMETFARYGFNNAHAAAYGMVAYFTAWSKSNWPLFYMTHAINAEAGVGNKEEGYNFKVAQYIEEARSLGLQTMPPCVKQSGYECTYNLPGTIRFGMSLIKRVSMGGIKWIMERLKTADSLKEFIMGCYEQIEIDVEQTEKKPAHKEWRSYARVTKTDLENLTHAGAFDIFSTDRDHTLAMLPKLTEMSSKWHEQSCKIKNSVNVRLKPDQIAGDYQNYYLDPEDGAVKRVNLEERLQREHAVTGVFLSQSPFEPFRNIILNYQTCSPEELEEGDVPHGVMRYAAMITGYRELMCKNGKSKGKMMAFMDVIGTAGSQALTVFPDNLPRIKEAVITESERAQGAPHGNLLKNKIYLIEVRPDRDGVRYILVNARRLSDNNCSF